MLLYGGCDSRVGTPNQGRFGCEHARGRFHYRGKCGHRRGPGWERRIKDVGNVGWAWMSRSRRESLSLEYKTLRCSKDSHSRGSRKHGWTRQRRPFRRKYKDKRAWNTYTGITVFSICFDLRRQMQYCSVIHFVSSLLFRWLHTFSRTELRVMYPYFVMRKC